MKKRALRTRVWQGDNAKARDVGENLRDTESAINSQFVPTRVLTIRDVVYQPPLIVPSESKPEGVLTIHTEQMSGVVQFTSAFVDFKWSDGELRLTVNGLVAGVRYAALKFLVIG